MIKKLQHTHNTHTHTHTHKHIHVHTEVLKTWKTDIIITFH